MLNICLIAKSRPEIGSAKLIINWQLDLCICYNQTARRLLSLKTSVLVSSTSELSNTRGAARGWRGRGHCTQQVALRMIEMES